MQWQWIIAIAPRISIITIKRPRQSPRALQNQRRLSPPHPMTPNVPWIAALRDICGAAQQFPAILIFLHRL
jgi:hypothetical protein